ncbi:MAG: type VI secretion system contractile sheath large subunit [Planctomycetaceae bacterium]
MSEQSAQETREQVLLADEPSTPAASPSLLDRMTQAEAARSSSARAEVVADFLNAGSAAEGCRLWLGYLPDTELRKNTARRQLAKDISRIDAMLSRQVNAILHHPQFQALEAAWRGLELLTRTAQKLTLENEREGEHCQIQLRVLNVSKKELQKDFEDAVDFDQNMLFRKVYEEEFGIAGGNPYGALVANYEFTNHPDDIDLLAQLSGVGAAAFAPVIAAADPSLLGLDSFQTLEQPVDLEKIFQQPKHRKWRSLRERPDSQFLGLTLPRILMRTPYEDTGAKHHGFRFREEVEGSDNSHYLWGSSAWAMATVIMRAFASSGWFADLRGVERGVEGGGLVTELPVHSFGTDPFGVALKSSAEVAVSDQQDAELTQQGFIPLSHCKGTPYSVFYSNQSVHQPKEYDDAAATANARISSMLQYVLCCSRIAHYLKLRARNKIGSAMSPREIEDDLGTWLVEYVTPDEKAPPSMKARFPLREAEVKVAEVPGEPGKYMLTIRLLPHYQLDQLSSSMTLVARRVDGL